MDIVVDVIALKLAQCSSFFCDWNCASDSEHGLVKVRIDRAAERIKGEEGRDL
jgi:uncharacterized CHY-type Zn-finger protein